MNDFDAKEAADHSLHPVARFGELNPGARFRFPGQHVALVRTRSGYRRAVGGPVFRTGAKVLVAPFADAGNASRLRSLVVAG